MTITYSSSVSTSRGFPSAFVRLLKRWRGSIYKLVYGDLLIFLGLYYAMKAVYLYALDKEQKHTFEMAVSYFTIQKSKIPATFVLGFYVVTIAARWSSQVFSVPWPDPAAVFVSSQVRGNDERGRKMRRTVMRYLNLSYVLLFRLISTRAKKRFPTLAHLVDAGLLVENEKEIIMAMDEIYPKQPKYWMPIIWASSIFTRARKEGRIRDDFALRTLNDAINAFRHSCILMLHYDTISVPLVYTQAVAIAMYTYFFSTLIAAQWVDGRKKDDLNYYFPLFTVLEFVFFMGWLKVAETLICPFGDDDDDFEVNAMIDRNIQVSYIIVDEMHNRHPHLIKDQYWDEVYPYEIPGTDGGQPEHSTARMDQKQPFQRSHSFAPLNPALSGIVRSPSFWSRLPSRQVSDIHIQMDRSTDSERTWDNQIFSRLLDSVVSVSPSFSTIEEEYEEELDVEVEDEDEDDGITFERLREERERERLERQQQKVQRTVENAVDATEELRLRRHPSLEDPSSSTDTLSDGQTKPHKRGKNRGKEEDDQDRDPDNA